jgi:hypothetical protein
VIVEVVEPSAGTEVGEAATVDCAGLTVPAVPAAVNVTGLPERLPEVAVTV